MCAKSIRLLHGNNSYGVPSRSTQCRVLNSRDTFWLPERVVSRMHHVRGFRGRSYVGAPRPRLHEETTRLAQNDYQRFPLIIRSNETIFLPRLCRRILANLPSLRSLDSPGRIQFHSSYLEYSTMHAYIYRSTTNIFISTRLQLDQIFNLQNANRESIQFLLSILSFWNGMF